METSWFTGNPSPGLFLDRDGTINVEVDYLRRAEQLKLLPGAARGIAQANRLKIPVIVVTNQSGIARGYLTEDDLAEIHATLDQLLAAEGAHIDAYLYCPHHAEAKVPAYRMDCSCRKPRAGLLFAAAALHGIDVQKSYLVGDKPSDLVAARSVGCTDILIRTGYGQTTETTWPETSCPPWHTANNLEEAVWRVMADLGLERERKVA